MVHAIASGVRARPRLVSEVTEGQMEKTEFTVDDFANQMLQVRKLEPLGKLIAPLPGMGEMTRQIGDPDRAIGRMVGVYHSMTIKERQHPDLVNSQRRRRIAGGAGVRVEEVTQFLR